MPRVLLTALVAAALCGAVLVTAGTSTAWAGECSCAKCASKRASRCGKCNGKWGNCMCGKNGVPTLKQIEQNPLACCQPRTYGNPDLFYNYYMDPGCGIASAAMYLAPHEVPAHVGHTYYTYQPLMPHEYLYPHHRTYHRYYDGGRGLTRAKVHWYVGPLSAIGQSLHHVFEIPR